MESATTFAERGEVWLYPGDAGWHFVTLPPDVADELRACSAETARAFGLVPVRATLGATSWTTSLFADPSRPPTCCRSRPPRGGARIEAGDAVTVTIELR